MTRTLFCSIHRSTVLALGLLVGCYLTVCPSRVRAGDDNANPATTYTPVAEGSAPTHRSVTDTFSGQVNIYVGSSFPAGTNLLYFQYLFDLTTKGNTTGYITPLLFEWQSVEAFTIYTVVGIGKSFEAKLATVPQAIPFDIVAGTKVPTAGNFTFGFTTAIVNSSGVTVATSPGVVDYDTPTDGGLGVGGSLTTNDWIWTVGEPGPAPAVAVGTTFGVSGSNADYALGVPYRTYSAQAIGAIAAQ
jgi:hypothetical protein